MCGERGGGVTRGVFAEAALKGPSDSIFAEGWGVCGEDFVEALRNLSENLCNSSRKAVLNC